MPTLSYMKKLHVKTRFRQILHLGYPPGAKNVKFLTIGKYAFGAPTRRRFLETILAIFRKIWAAPGRDIAGV